MSRNAIDRMKSQGSAKAKQNRTKRREESAKNYGRSGHSASDKAYINGNYKKVASNKAYGYRQGVKKGEIVRGSDSDWLSDGNIYRTTKVKEDQSWNKTTTQKGKQKYAILGSHKGKQAKNLGDQFNLGTWDGMRTAKANMRKGKHLSNALELGKGLLKDTVVDAGVDFMKGVGVIGSTAIAGLGGAMEDSGKVFSGIADQKRTIKDYSQGRSAIKENLKANKEALNKTGFGIGFGEMLNSAKDRADEAEIAMLKKEGKHKEAKAYADKVKKEKGTATKALNATGFVMDILAPTTIEDKITDSIKILGKNTAKSFKQLKDGTADLSVGFKAGASDDIFFSGKKGTTAIDKKLDNEYSKVLDNAKDTVKNTLKQNPKTQNIGKYLDVLDEKPLKGTQRSIDGRTLNKKYTQTKDGYVPQQIRGVDEVTEVANNNVKGQYSMFGKDGTMNAFTENMSNPNARFERVLNKYGNDVDGLIEKIDSMKPQNADAMYDYLQKNHPKLYNEVLKDSNRMDDLIYNTANTNYLQSAKDKARVNAPTQRSLNGIKPVEQTDNVVEYIQNLNKNYNEFNIDRMFNPEKLQPIQEAMNILDSKGIFNKEASDYLFTKLANQPVEELNVVSELFEGMINNIDNIDTSVIAKQLNDLVFNGKNVIRSNMPKNIAKGLVEYFGDITNYHKATKVGKEIQPFRNSLLKGKYDVLTDAQRANPNLDVIRYMTQGVTDTAYELKRSDVGSRIGVKNKSKEIDEPLNAYFKKKKEGIPLTQEEFRHFKDLQSRKKIWDDLFAEINDLNPDEYAEYAKKKFGGNKFDDAVDEYADLASRDNRNIIDDISAKGTDPDVTASPRVQAEMARKQDVKEFNHITQSNATGNIKNIPAKQFKQNYSKELGLSYVNTKYPIQINKARQTLEGVRSYKPVDKAISNLEKLMNKEVALTIKGNINQREYETLRTLVKENVQMLDKLGVNPNAYFGHIKQMKMQLLQDGQITKNLRGAKPKSGKVKNTVKNIKNPLDNLQIKVNGKELNPIHELTPDELQWKYLLTEGAKSIDELFDAMPGSIPQRGDNIGNEISSMLRPNKTPLDKLDEVVSDTDEFVDDFERVIEKENMESSLQLREKLNQDANKIKKKAEIDPRTEERLKYYEDKLNLPEPKSLFDDIELPPGVDEDGVIIDTKKGMGSYFKNKHIEMLNGEYKPKDVPTFEEFKKGVKENNPKLAYEDEKLYGVYKSWLNSYKKGLTVYNPGWHVQNFFQNKGQNALALGVDAFMPQTKAKNVLKQMNGEKAKDINIFDAKNLRSYSSDEIGKLAQEFGVIDGLGEDVRNARGIFPRVEDAIDNSKLMKTLEKNEQTARLHHFITQLERGMSPEQASKSVNKYLFDYNNKGKMDKVVGDFVDPFWTFHKNNARLIGTSMFEHAGKMNQIVRGRDDLEYGVQDEQNENSKYGKIQMPYTTIKDSVNGDDYNYLYKENMMPDIEGALPLDDEEMENKMNPILRMILQHSRGEGNFGNKVVDVKEGEEPGWNKITKEQRLKEVAMDLNPFMPNLVKTLDSEKKRQQKVEDGKQSQEITDKQILLDWINYITGNKGNYYRNLDF